MVGVVIKAEREPPARALNPEALRDGPMAQGASTRVIRQRQFGMVEHEQDIQSFITRLPASAMFAGTTLNGHNIRRS